MAPIAMCLCAVSGLDPNKMAKYPVAPDGFIPNSVIRDRVQTVYPPPNFFDQFSLGGCNDKNFQDMDEDDRKLMYVM